MFTHAVKHPVTPADAVLMTAPTVVSAKNTINTYRPETTHRIPRSEHLSNLKQKPGQERTTLVMNCANAFPLGLTPK